MQKKVNQNLIAILIIFQLSFIIYIPSFFAPMVFDDNLHFIDQETIKSFDKYSSFSYWADINNRPFSFLTFSLNYLTGGLKVFGFHLVNLIIHIAFGIACFFLSKRLLLFTEIDRKKINVISLFIALVCIAHPIQTQAVTYIIQRMTCLAALFFVLAILSYIEGRVEHSEKNKVTIRALFCYLSTICLFYLSIASKQNTIVLPLFLPLIEFLFIRINSKINYKIILIYLLLITIISVFVLVRGIPQETDEISRFDYFVTQAKVIVKYLQLIFLPVSQNLDYDFPVSHSVGLLEIVSLGFHIIMIIFATFSIKKDKFITFGILWFYLTLFVESSIIPIRDVIFEHRLYLPLFGFALVFVRIIQKITKTNKTLIILIIIFVSINGFLTYRRNIIWSNSILLWQDVVNKSPQKARGWCNLGKAYLENNDLKAAEETLHMSIKKDSTYFNSYYNLGNLYMKKKDYVNAEKYYLLTFKYHLLLKALNNLGGIYFIQQRYDEAELIYKISLEIKPDYIIALLNIGKIMAIKRDYDKSLYYFKSVLSFDDDNSEAIKSIARIEKLQEAIQ